MNLSKSTSLLLISLTLTAFVGGCGRNRRNQVWGVPVSPPKPFSKDMLSSRLLNTCKAFSSKRGSIRVAEAKVIAKEIIPQSKWHPPAFGKLEFTSSRLDNYSPSVLMTKDELIDLVGPADKVEPEDNNVYLVYELTGAEKSQGSEFLIFVVEGYVVFSVFQESRE